MRIFAALFLLGTIAAGQASASSFVSLPEVKGPSRSIIVLGQPAPAVPEAAAAESEVETAPPAELASRPEEPEQGSDALAVRVISRSVIAMGEPAVAFEKVAAIAPRSIARRGPAPMPMVMRGGIIGDAFATPASAAEPAKEEVRAKAPQEEGKQPTAPKEPVPQPAAPPPPPPPSMPKLRGVE